MYFPKKRIKIAGLPAILFFETKIVVQNGFEKIVVHLVKWQNQTIIHIVICQKRDGKEIRFMLYIGTDIVARDREMVDIVFVKKSMSEFVCA